MATLAFAPLEVALSSVLTGVGREDLILTARVAADAPFKLWPDAHCLSGNVDGVLMLTEYLGVEGSV